MELTYLGPCYILLEPRAKTGSVICQLEEHRTDTCFCGVRKEIEIKEHIPVPYWVLSATFKKNGQIVKASYIKEKLLTLTEANSVFNYCMGKTSLVKEMMADKVIVSPPSPFNIGDSQREAYRLFSISPKITLSIAALPECFDFIS